MIDLDDKNLIKKTSYLKLIFIGASGTGLITNAIYIFGLGYYEGYLKGMGFLFDLFPISTTNSAFMWTYHASRHLAVDIINFITEKTSLKIPFYTCIVIFFAIWIILGINSTEKKIHVLENYFFYKIIMYFQRNIKNIWLTIVLYFKLATIQKDTSMVLKKPISTFKRINHGILSIIKIIKFPIHFFISLFIFLFSYFFANQRSFKAALISYFSLVAFVFLPILALSWWFFPYTGIKYGIRTANEVIEKLNKRPLLCQDEDNKWEQCISFEKNGEQIEGIIISKEANLLALYTKKGPLTITEPTEYYFYTKEKKTDINVTH